MKPTNSICNLCGHPSSLLLRFEQCYTNPLCPNYVGTEPKPGTWGEWAKAKSVMDQWQKRLDTPRIPQIGDLVPYQFKVGDRVQITKEGWQRSGGEITKQKRVAPEGLISFIPGAGWWGSRYLKLVEPAAKGEVDAELWTPRVGDLVRVRGDGPRMIRWNDHGEMDRYVGLTGRITLAVHPYSAANGLRGVGIEDWGATSSYPDHRWNWHLNDLELVEKAEARKTPMSKSDMDWQDPRLDNFPVAVRHPQEVEIQAETWRQIDRIQYRPWLEFYKSQIVEVTGEGPKYAFFMSGRIAEDSWPSRRTHIGEKGRVMELGYAPGTDHAYARVRFFGNPYVPLVSLRWHLADLRVCREDE